MLKCKIKKHRDEVQLIITNESGQRVNVRDVNGVNQQLKHLVPIELEERGVNFALKYELSYFLPARLFLGNVLTVGQFIDFLDVIVATIEQIKELHYNEKAIIYDLEYLYIDVREMKPVLIYVPIQFYESTNKLTYLIRQIARTATVEDERVLDQVEQILEMHNDSSPLYDLRKYINAFHAIKRSGRICPVCGKESEPDSNFCTGCGYRF